HAAGVERQALVQAELEREVGDSLGDRAALPPEPGPLGGHVAVELLEQALEVGAVAVVARQLEQPGLVDQAEQADGIVAALTPSVAVDACEQLDRAGVPG